MAKKKKKETIEETDKTEIVEPEEEKALVLTKGTTLDLWREGDSVFTGALSADMSPEERKSAVREVLKTSQLVDDRLNLVQGEMLYEVQKNEYWKDWKTVDEETGEERPFTSFKEYAFLECQMKHSRACYLTSIYEKFVLELELPPEILKDLEWSKVKELTNFVNADNWKEHLDAIDGLTLQQVRDYASKILSEKKPRESSSTGAEGVSSAKEPEIFTILKFPLAPDQLENVNTALKLVRSMTGSDKPGNQLDQICSDFVSCSSEGIDGAMMKLDVIKKNIERTYGVTFEIAAVDEERYEKLKKESDEKEAKELKEEKIEVGV